MIIQRGRHLAIPASGQLIFRVAPNLLDFDLGRSTLTAKLLMNDVVQPDTLNARSSTHHAVGRLLRQVHLKITSAVEHQTAARLGVTAVQAAIILMLQTTRQVRAADLSREHGVDASAVTRLIDRLSRRGLVERVQSKADRRVVHILLTEQGIDLAARIPEVVNPVLEDMFRGLNSNELASMSHLLEQVVAHHET